ncbi:hypothetical protein BAX99_03280 [Elizabethkingia miricola]|nr:hypothetical protein BAX99_03280 [Elizabethkingia miricola]
MNSECPLLGILWQIIQYLKSKNMKKLFTLKHTNTKVLTRKQLRDVVGGSDEGDTDFLFTCPYPSTTIKHFKNCDTSGVFIDGSGGYCGKRSEKGWEIDTVTC